MIKPAIFRFEEVGSTNDIALGMARNGASEGTVVIARSQTRGRGRRGRSWISEPGESVIMSVILRPDVPASRHSELAFAAGIAVAECLQRKCGLRPTLKWPNDVLVNSRKIAGVLIESEPRAAIVGIGVNVLQNSFPHDLAETATSVSRECRSARGEERASRGGGPTPLALSSEERAYRRAGDESRHADLDIETLAAVILERLFAACVLSFEEILTCWRKYMWGLGRSVDIVTEGGTTSGKITGIDTDGALLIDRGGIIRRIIAADAINVRTT
jgi:BirA family transcriptional regulator, biotin operon repressor / biotin---[acetyl-CoA-carboxylase] ligase